MKTLTLMRHAKSDWSHAGLSDHDRPLNKRGQAAAPMMAARLAEKWLPHERPDLLLSSSAVRAFTTAEAVADALSVPLEAERRLYPFVGADVAAVLAEQPGRFQHLMLFGHNPGISYLAASLGAPVDMPTAAVVSLQFDCESWSALLAQRCVDYWYDWPKSEA